MSYIVVGVVVGSHGLEGRLKVIPRVGDRSVIERMKTLHIGKGSMPTEAYKIVELKSYRKGYLIAAEGIYDRNRSLFYNGFNIFVPKEDLPELPRGDLYWHQIEGADVYDEKMNFIGKLESYLESGSSDVFVIRGGCGSEHLVSNNEHHVLKIDVANSVIVINSMGLVSD